LTETEYQVDELNCGTKYYWRVEGKNMTGTNAWSTVCRFTTEIPVQEIPVLYLPPDEIEEMPLSVMFEWAAIECALWYHIQVAFDSLFRKLIVNNANVIDTFYSANVCYGLRYFWRVAGGNMCGPADWSEVWRFTTITAEPDTTPWEYLGLEGHNITSILAVDSNIIYVSSKSFYHGGIYKTTDAGKNWDRLSTLLISSMKMHPYNSKIIYAGIWQLADPPH